MDNAKSSSAERKNTVGNITITSGLGIFSGKPEITGRIGCLIISVICIISTIVFAIGLFGTGPMVQDNIVLMAIYILITVLVVFFTVLSFTYPFRTRKKFIFEGIWFSKDKIWLGEHEIELKEKCSINNLMNDNCTNHIQANWNQTIRATFIDIPKTSIIVQLVNSKHDYKTYRIGKINILKVKNDLDYDFDSRPTVLLSNGILYTCSKLTLIDQLRKIAKGTKAIQKNGGICNLYITPSSKTLWDSSERMENVSDLNNTIKNKTKAQCTMNALQTGKFIDKVHSDFLITLIKDYGWKIEFYPLKMNVTD
jgi:hypothetical protein